MSVKRIAELKKSIQKENLDGVVINHLDHIRYLTGFSGSAGLLIVTAKGSDFFTDFRYKDQSAKQVKGAKVNIIKSDPYHALKDFPKFNKQNLVYGFNEDYFTVGGQEKLRQSLPNGILVKAGHLFTELGWVKDNDEIKNIQKAVDIADIAYSRILNMIEPGIKEIELAAELEYQMIMLGSEKPAFDTQVVSGYRTAMPHGAPSRKKIKKGEFVTFDFGATVNGYVSDMTRSVVVGKATTRQKKIYNLVLKAQKAGIKKIKPGVLGKAVDNVCRSIITKAGYGKNFGHGTGHGIGYFVHVGPRLSSISNDKLKPGNVITVEPGIYISGWGGVRIEDDVLVTRSGNKVMNKAPKKLLEL